MSTEPVGQPWDSSGTEGVPLSPGQSTPLGQLKSLARKVLNSSVPLSQPLVRGTVGQSIAEPPKSGTPVGQLRDSGDLFESMKRLEAAGICIAIFENGDMRIVVSETDTLEAIDAGAAIYSPQDMYMCVTLNEHERRMLHSFKKRFGGTTEWRPREIYSRNTVEDRMIASIDAQRKQQRKRQRFEDLFKKGKANGKRLAIQHPAVATSAEAEASNGPSLPVLRAWEGDTGEGNRPSGSH